MLIEAPCRLGERFTHRRRIGCPPKHPMLVGMDLFLWHCGLDGVVLMGARSRKENPSFFERKDMDALPVSIEVPDAWVEGDCAPEELGMDTGKIWRLCGIRLVGDRGWGYRMSDKNRESKMVRTEPLDKLFAPLLPARPVDLVDFL